jgi:adenine-specific DNA-methyltransferase
VLDPYVGVGSSVIAAVKHGREGFGCDIQERYIAIAQERLELLAAGILRTRPMGLPVYDPALPKGGHV